jgi:hypothetical protein
LVTRGFLERPPFETVQEAVDAGIYTVWDGPTAIQELGDVIRRYPQVEEILFMVTYGAGQPLHTTNERIQYIADYIVPRLKAIRPD